MKMLYLKICLSVCLFSFIPLLLIAGTHEDQSASKMCKAYFQQFCKRPHKKCSEKKTLNILFDSWSNQVMNQKQPCRYPIGVQYPSPTYQRLNTILGAMKSIGFSTGVEWKAFCTKARVTREALEKMDVYVSLTRQPNIPQAPDQGIGFAYSNKELSALQEFVSNGGGILLMTDHGQFPEDTVPSFTESDSALAQRFGITLLNLFVTGTDMNYMLMEMDPELPTEFEYLSYQVQGISAHDSCAILPPITFTPLVLFPDAVSAYDFALDEYVPLPSPYFAILVPYGAGNVIVVGNSGMVGDWGSTQPGPGLITLDNNLMFFLNCVGYLGGLRCIPPVGKAPCAL